MHVELVQSRSAPTSVAGVLGVIDDDDDDDDDDDISCLSTIME
jgi:hypothetical protein